MLHVVNMGNVCMGVEKCRCECFKQVSGDPRRFDNYYISIDIRRKPGQPYCLKCGHYLPIDKLPGEWKKSHEEGYHVKLMIGKEEIKASA
jgi:hypothetical protein